MKKQSILRLITTFVLALMLLAVLVSCGGKDGKDAITPTIEISEDGYWVINGAKTEIKAVGTDGVDGKDGKDGVDGKNGSNGVDPTIEISEDGYWVINGKKTNVKASSDVSVDENPQRAKYKNTPQVNFVGNHIIPLPFCRLRIRK